MRRCQLRRILRLLAGGTPDKRFKAFIAHDGIFNMEQQYLETEEMWFANWDMGGAYGTKTMQRHNVPLPTLLIVSLINGTLPFSAFTVKRDIEFLLHKVCRRSMQLYCAVFRPNFYYIRMRIMGIETAKWGVMATHFL